MPSIDCVDEIEIDAPITTVFDTVLNYPEWHSWIPIYRCKLIDADCVEEGVKIQHLYGYKPIVMGNFIRAINKISKDQAIEESYVDGDLIGQGVWTFREYSGKTIAAYHCKVRSNRMISHIGFFLMGEKAHRNIYKPLLQKLKNYCEKL